MAPFFTLKTALPPNCFQPWRSFPLNKSCQPFCCCEYPATAMNMNNRQRESFIFYRYLLEPWLWFKEEIKLNKNALIYKNFSRKEKMSCAKNFSIEHLIKIQIIHANGKVSKKEGSVNKKK